MTWGLTRFQHSEQSHFVTFCCYHQPIRLLCRAQPLCRKSPLLAQRAREKWGTPGRLSLLTNDESWRVFEEALGRVRRSFRLRVYGYVVMPEHVHLLLSEPERDTKCGGSAPLKHGSAPLGQRTA